MSFFGKLFGSGSIGGKTSLGIGNWLNDITGVTGSSAKQFEQNMAMQKDAQNFTKWQMGNAHQQEVADLQKAGLNPVLSAGGDGAGGTPSMGSTSPGVSGANPIEMIMGLINTANNSAKTNADINNQTNKTNSEIQKNNAEILKIAKENGYTDEKIANAIKERDEIIARTEKAKSEKELIDAQKDLEKWNSEHALLKALVPVGAAVLGGLTGGVGGAIAGGIAGAHSAKTVNHIHYNK